MTKLPCVSVIMPTRARRERADLLRRALRSVVEQGKVRAIPLIVVNGNERDPELCGALEADRRCRVFFAEEANLPAALAIGRARVDSPWFSELDDDDEYLPESLARRIAAFPADEPCDVVVGNGIRRSAVAADRLQVGDASRVQADPLRALVACHWLMPGAYLCRTDTVGPDLFAGMPPYLENTYLAIRFALDYRFVFLDEPTVIRHLNSPGAESKSFEYVVGQVEAIRRLLEFDLPPDVRRVFRRRVADACHTASVQLLAGGDRAAAWRWHLRSVRESGGWRYLAYTRRLLLPTTGSR